MDNQQQFEMEKWDESELQAEIESLAFLGGSFLFNFIDQRDYFSRAFAVLIRMLLDIEDEDVIGHSSSTSTYGRVLECLDCLAGENTIFPVASEQLDAYLASPDWRKRHAALVALAQISKGCSKAMIENSEQVVTMVLNSFRDHHPRVRWAAINAMGVLSTYLGPHLQLQYHARVLPALASAMDDVENPRVQAHAASAVINFSENCTPDILRPYLDGIVSKLCVLLQSDTKMVKEGALTALESVAHKSSEEQFQKYYDEVMPCLKGILVNNKTKADRMLRAKAMECICLVGMAVEKDKFRDDAKQVMEVLMSLQGAQMETDDPITCYMLRAWGRLCKCLGQDFLPYIAAVMPLLLQSAQLKPITSADSDNEIESADESMETIVLGDKRIGIKTVVLEEIASACNVLCIIADELREGFFPWIEQVVPIFVPLLKFCFHEVRKAAVSAMPGLLRSSKLAVEKGLAQGGDGTCLKKLSDYIVPALVEALHKEPDIETIANILHALSECLQISGLLLDGNQVRSILDTSSSRMGERAKRIEGLDFDEELLKEGNEKEKDVFDQTKKKRDSAELLSRVQRLTVERDAYKKQLAVERAEYADYRAEFVSKLDEVRGSYSALEDHCSQLEHELVEERKMHKQKIRRLEEGLKQAESRAAAAESRLESELKFMTKCQDAANEADDKVADVQVALGDIWKDTFTSWRSSSRI